jgi:hypothetical protein
VTALEKLWFVEKNRGTLDKLNLDLI